MENFCQLNNRINGEPLPSFPPPVEYNLQTMGFSRTGGHELSPLSQEDMARVAHDDVVADMEVKKKMGWNPQKLGPPMSDEEFHKFYGLEVKTKSS